MSIVDIALIDDDKDYCTLFECSVKKTDDLHLVGYAHTGKDGIELIKTTLPDVVFLDNYLHEVDSGDVLREITDLKLVKKPKVIVICSYKFEKLIPLAFENGADLFLYKDYGIDLLFERCRTLAKMNNQRVDSQIELKKDIPKDPERLVSNILRELGIPANLKGYDYLRRGILMAVEDQTVLCGITKILYPDIATATNTDSWNVERAIRNAIHTSWERSNTDVYMEYFKPIIDKNKGKPTNSEFIATISQIVRSYCS